MISSIKRVITSNLDTLYPGIIIYDEDVPQGFKTPSFMILLINQDYEKLLNTKSQSLLSFDIAYFSDQQNLNNDIQEVQLNLLRAFDLIILDSFKIRVLNKRCNTTDNVLHFLFDVNHREISEEAFIKMQKQTTNTRM